jgi:DNA-binding transcriptional LysR family regulator
MSDLHNAFRYAGRSVLTPGDVKQMDAVRAATRPGSTLLLTSGPNGMWASILWQRALYPERTVIVIRDGTTPARLAAALKTYRFDGAISIGDPPPDPGLASHRDLGAIPGLSGRVWLGELRR